MDKLLGRGLVIYLSGIFAAAVIIGVIVGIVLWELVKWVLR